MRYPRPLAPGDTIGVTAPSSGVGPGFEARLDASLAVLRARGYEVELGECLLHDGHLSAPAPERAAELTRMLLDPCIRAVVPPWGGETGIDLLPHLDLDAIARAEPTWLVGYSDTSTLLTPITLRTATATLHSACLMEAAHPLPHGMSSWLDVAALGAGESFRQVSPGNGWSRLDAGREALDISGRLIGGCIETLANVTGTPFASAAAVGALGATIVYVEACEDDAFAICRNLHGMRLAGFFDTAAAVLIGHTDAPDSRNLTQREAVVDALGMLGVPIIADVEIGHAGPQLTVVNGSVGRVVMDGGAQWLEQRFA